ncbi:MAG: Fur family transcriptional regulator [Actinomycetota bacterium]
MELHRAVASRLASSGQRYTSTRRRLVDILAKAGMPLALPDIVRRRRGLPQSSAYRNLAELETAGLVRRVVSEDGLGRYELAEELTGHHHHLMCSRCGRVQDLHLPATLERQLDRTLDTLARESGFATVAHRLDQIGLCRDCAGRVTRSSRPGPLS